MRSVALTLILLALWPAGAESSQQAVVLEPTSESDRAATETPPEPLGAAVIQHRDLTIHEALVAGRLRDWSVVPRATGPAALVLLLRTEEQNASSDFAHHLVLWNLSEQGQLQTLAQDLPAEAASVTAADLDGDGVYEVLVAAGEHLLAPTGDGSWAPRYSARAALLPVPVVVEGVLLPPSTSELVMQGVGVLQSVRFDPATRLLHRSWQVNLPLRANREWGGLRLDSPPIERLMAASDDSVLLFVGPEAYGKRRLRSLVLTIDGDAPAEPLEAWSMLPTPEEVEESWYVRYNGEPALIVTSVMAEKHGVFEKKKLRLFSLSADRSRAGAGPLLEVVTKSRNWYGTCVGIADVNGDGLDDLVSGQPKGLGGGKLWLAGHLARTGDSFETQPRGMELDVEEGERCSLRADISGDGVVDLVVVEDDSLLVFPLLQSAKAKRLVEPSPRWQVGFDDIDGPPHPVRLFGEASVQILLSGVTPGGRQAIRVVRFR